MYKTLTSLELCCKLHEGSLLRFLLLFCKDFRSVCCKCIPPGLDDYVLRREQRRLARGLLVQCNDSLCRTPCNEI